MPTAVTSCKVLCPYIVLVLEVSAEGAGGCAEGAGSCAEGAGCCAQGAGGCARVMRHVLEPRARAVSAGSCAPCAGGREGRAACACRCGDVPFASRPSKVCNVKVCDDAGRYSPCAALYVGGSGG